MEAIQEPDVLLVVRLRLQGAGVIISAGRGRVAGRERALEGGRRQRAQCDNDDMGGDAGAEVRHALQHERGVGRRAQPQRAGAGAGGGAAASSPQLMHELKRVRYVLDR